MVELETATRLEKEKEAKAREKAGKHAGSEGDDEDGADEGSGTETEDAGPGVEIVSGKPPVPKEVEEKHLSAQDAPKESQLRRRKRESFGEGSSAGDLSTDSEWDKVEEAGEIRR